MPYMLITAGLIVSAILALTMLGRIVTAIRRFSLSQPVPLITDERVLPTVSVCIPARNETHAMTQCLERVIASDYTKLEIIVLDDASEDNTSYLIKSFAHAGVRFVEGSPLPDDWLGKNHAEHNLYETASGEFVLFLDVDTHVSPQSISAMVALLRQEDADMLSVLPTRDDHLRASTLFATLRNFWVLLFHGVDSPAVASNAWLVSKSFLRDTFRGLEKVKSYVAPEQIVAHVAATKNKYRFYISDAFLGVSYEKKWRSQCETSVRLLFPHLGGRVAGAFFALCAMTLLALPFVTVLYGLFAGLPAWIIVTAFVITLVIFSSHALYAIRTWRYGRGVGSLLFPVILLQEAVLIILSTIAYLTHSVTWKGRPIKLPSKHR